MYYKSLFDADLDKCEKGGVQLLENPVKAKLTEMYVTENSETKKQRKCSIPLGQIYELKPSTLYIKALEVHHEQVPATDLFYEDIEIEGKLIKVTRNVRQGSPNPKIETFIVEKQG